MKMFLIKSILYSLFIVAASTNKLTAAAASPHQRLITYDEGYIDLYGTSNNKDSTPPASSSLNRKPNDIVLALNLPLSIPKKSFDDNGIPINRYNPAKHYASAAALAMHKINNDSTMLNGYRLRYAWDRQQTDTGCIEKNAINIMLRQLNMNVSGFLGFNCHCRTVSKISSAVNLPLFSSVSLLTSINYY